MNNYQILEAINELPLSVNIDRLIWIALNLEDASNIRDIVGDMSKEDLKECFPEIPYDYLHSKDRYCASQTLIDHDKFGFLAELHIAIPSNFTYKKNKPVSWSSSMSRCSIRYVYAETTEELSEKIKTIVNEEFEEAWKKEINATKV